MLKASETSSLANVKVGIESTIGPAGIIAVAWFKS